MKKSLVLMAMAGVALAGCVNDVADVAQKEQMKAIIGFDKPVLYNNAESRANFYGEISEVTSDRHSYPTNEQFVIYAVSHEDDLAGWANATPAPFNGNSISFVDDVDGWAPKQANGKYYYWETGKKMSFAASSPADLEHDAVRTYGPAGLKIENFIVNGDAGKQYDLLFSTRNSNQTAANMNHSANYYSGIPIEFQHALSSIRFSIANSSSEDVVLTGIQLAGVKYKGEFNEGIVEDSNPQDEITDYGRSGIYTKGVNVHPAWTVEDDIITSPYLAFNGSVKFRESPRYVSELVKEAKEGDVATYCHQLLLMPQVLTDDAVVVVNYTVNGVPAEPKTVQLKGLKSSKLENGENVETGTINEWIIGNRYTYRLYYSDATADKDKIYFAPSTEAWKDVDVIIVNL